MNLFLKKEYMIRVQIMIIDTRIYHMLSLWLYLPVKLSDSSEPRIGWNVVGTYQETGQSNISATVQVLISEVEIIMGCSGLQYHCTT